VSPDLTGQPGAAITLKWQEFFTVNFER